MLKGSYKNSYYRYIINICGGLSNSKFIILKKERIANFFDVKNRIYVLYVGEMDEYGCSEVGYVYNGIVSKEKVLFPELIDLKILKFALISHENSLF